MYIQKSYSFDAMHFLPRHTGKCKEVHGHTYKVSIGLVGKPDPATGFVLDYAALDEIVKPLIKRFDHKTLNCFIQYPSAENIATHIAHELYGRFAYLQDIIVEVSETPNTVAVWKLSEVADFARFDDEFDREWKSPVIQMSFDLPKDIKEAKELAQMALKTFIMQQTRLEQLRLYRDSLQPLDANSDSAKVLEAARKEDV